MRIPARKKRTLLLQGREILLQGRTKPENRSLMKM
jgi:hypothetical protein